MHIYVHICIYVCMYVCMYVKCTYVSIQSNKIIKNFSCLTVKICVGPKRANTLPIDKLMKVVKQKFVLLSNQVLLLLFVCWHTSCRSREPACCSRPKNHRRVRTSLTGGGKGPSDGMASYVIVIIKISLKWRIYTNFKHRMTRQFTISIHKIHNQQLHWNHVYVCLMNH